MLQFSRDPKGGLCAFADRRRFRAELHWSEIPGPPDFDRMMKDYRSSLSGQGWSDLDLLRIAGCHGLTGVHEGRTVSRFGRHLPGAGILVELVLIHDAERDRDLERTIVGSLDWEAPDDRGNCRWRAFGMEMKVPASATLTECVVQPGSVGIRFDGKKQPERHVFRRFGLVDRWMTGGLDAWVRQQAGRRVRPIQATDRTERGVRVVRLQGTYRPDSLLKRKGDYRAAAWIDPRDKRLYHVQRTLRNRPDPRGPVEPADAFLTACPEFTVVPERPFSSS